MKLTRRSFLKIAGLTTVAAAGAAMFTGCVAASVIQLAPKDSVYDQITEDAETEDDKAKIKKEFDQMIAAVNALLYLFPLVGVSSISVNELMSKLEDVAGKISDDYAESFKKFKEKIDVDVDEEGKIVATGDIVGILTVSFGLKEGTDAQALAL